MDEPFRIFIGWDSKEPIAYHVLAHSILTRSSQPVSITALRQDTLRAAGIYKRERGPTESTEFSLTRFLVPFLSDYSGYSLFMDCDMLCRCDLVGELWPVIMEQMFWGKGNYPNPKHDPNGQAAILCCQHDYTPNDAVKFLGNPQTVYPRKNWSSFMVFNNNRCKDLTPKYVNSASGLELHRFQWIPDHRIEPLPLDMNWLVGEYQPNPEAKVLHWTLGGPWYDAYENTDHADEWREEYDRMHGLVPA